MSGDVARQVIDASLANKPNKNKIELSACRIPNVNPSALEKAAF
jgi:hypothetical protein